MNSSLDRSLSGSTCLGRTVNPSRPRSSTVNVTAGRRSLSTQAKKLSEAERAKATRATPLKRADALPIQATPPKRILGRTTTIPPTASVQVRSALKAKPETLVLPTPTRGVKGVHSGDGTTHWRFQIQKQILNKLPFKPFFIYSFYLVDFLKALLSSVTRCLKDNESKETDVSNQVNDSIFSSFNCRKVKEKLEMNLKHPHFI